MSICDENLHDRLYRMGPTESLLTFYKRFKLLYENCNKLHIDGFVDGFFVARTFYAKLDATRYMHMYCEYTPCSIFYDYYGSFSNIDMFTCDNYYQLNRLTIKISSDTQLNHFLTHNLMNDKLLFLQNIHM